MPIEVSYTEDGGILLVVTGVATGREIKEVNHEIYETPEKIARILYQIVDFSNITSLDVTNSEVEDIAAQDKRAFQINPNMLVAVVGKDDLTFGLSRMWEALTYDGPSQTMVFRKSENAQQWIKERLQKTPHE
jgi:hypothetical protein